MEGPMLVSDENDLADQIKEVEEIVWPDTPLKQVKVKLRLIDYLISRVEDKYELSANPVCIQMFNQLIGVLLR